VGKQRTIWAVANGGRIGDAGSGRGGLNGGQVVGMSTTGIFHPASAIPVNGGTKREKLKDQTCAGIKKKGGETSRGGGEPSVKQRGGSFSPNG